MYNVAWNKVDPSGPSSPFLNTDSTWLGILEKDASNSLYLQLAQSYVSARLNIYYGAEASDVFLGNVSQAQALLEKYATSQDSVMGSPDQQAFSILWANLDNYNKGLTGPGPCPDCNQ